MIGLFAWRFVWKRHSSAPVRSRNRNKAACLHGPSEFREVRCGIRASGQIESALLPLKSTSRFDTGRQQLFHLSLSLQQCGVARVGNARDSRHSLPVPPPALQRVRHDRRRQRAGDSVPCSQFMPAPLGANLRNQPGDFRWRLIVLLAEYRCRVWAVARMMGLPIGSIVACGWPRKQSGPNAGNRSIAAGRLEADSTVQLQRARNGSGAQDLVLLQWSLASLSFWLAAYRSITARMELGLK